MKKNNFITEGRISYEEGHDERLNTHLVSQLRERKHSLGAHPIFPESDESHFEEKLISKRFNDVLRSYKRHNGSDNTNLMDVLSIQKEIFPSVAEIESEHKETLEKLAVDLIREEFDMPESDVEIDVELSMNGIDLSGFDKNNDLVNDIQFENHAELENSNKEVYKRRFINSLIQGSAKKTNHMFHMIDKELEKLSPELPTKYSKLMTAADLAYMLVDDSIPAFVGGKVKVELPKIEGQRPKIIAKAITLPVLIHELTKGVMEILSYHGLPKNENTLKYVLSKADHLNLEKWDMRLGPVIWEKFIESIPNEDFNLKHHIFIELVALPVDEFNHVMREIMMGSNEGKKKISDIVEDIKDDLRNDEFDDAMSHLSDDDYLDPEDLDNLDDGKWF